MNRVLSRRLATFVVGVALSSVTYGATVRADLGLGPYFLVQSGLERHLSWSPGTTAAVLGLLLVALAGTLRGGIGPGSFIAPILGGLIIDLTLPYLPELQGVPVRVVLFGVATAVMMLGAVLVQRSRLGANALDGIMTGLAARSGLSASGVRLAMEVTMVALGGAMGSSVGVGTVLTALLVGHAFQFWSQLLDRSPEQASSLSCVDRMRRASRRSPTISTRSRSCSAVRPRQ